MAWMALQFQWPCSVSNLELIFLCHLGRIKGFYGREVTSILAALISVQSGADISLPPWKNGRILWQRRHCSFSDLVQCPIWSWYSFATLKEYEDLWQGCHCSFSDLVQCPIWSWYSFATLKEYKDLWKGYHCIFSDPVQCPIWSWYSFATLKEYKDLWQGCHCSFKDPV